MQMEVYDSLGMMVMAESFDMWRYPKCKNGYARFFDQWADKDIEHLVRNHRNHPSLVMYSIGNEIPEQWSQEGVAIARRLQDICHRLDPTRQVTQGMDRAEDALKSGFAQVMDIPGFNYRVYKYDRNISKLPQGFLLGSETASTVSSRGVYKFPVTVSDKNVSGSLSGRALTISASPRPTTPTGRRAAAISESATSPDCPRTATISTARYGTTATTPSICCPTGLGRDEKAR